MVVLFIFIPLLGIGLGYIAAQKVVIPWLSENQHYEEKGPGAGGSADQHAGETEEAEEEESEPVLAYQQVLKLEGFSLYAVQVGAFSSRDNAGRLVEKLEELGIPADLKEEGLFKVFVFYAFDRDVAKTHLEHIKEYLPEDVHVSEIIYPSIGIGIPGSMVKNAEVLDRQFYSVREMLEDITESTAAGEELSTLAAEQESEVNALRQQLKALKLESPLAEYGELVDELYNSMLQAYSLYGSEEDGGMQLSVELVSNFVRFMDKVSDAL